MRVAKMHYITGIVSSDNIPSAESHVFCRSTWLALDGAAAMIQSTVLRPSSLC